MIYPNRSKRVTFRVLRSAVTDTAALDVNTQGSAGRQSARLSFPGERAVRGRVHLSSGSTGPTCAGNSGCH